jgi:hypothetical protein
MQRGLRDMHNKSELPGWAVLLSGLIEEIEEEQDSMGVAKEEKSR